MEKNNENDKSVNAGGRVVQRGRYMDMVHPSSDMRPPARDYAVGKKVDRYVPPVVQEPIEAEAEEVAEMPAEAEVEFGVVEDRSYEELDNGDMGAMVASEGFEEFDGFEETAETPNANNYSLGGKSPFIPDAKVEKRPLGDHVPANNVHGLSSTKNVYSQRTPAATATDEKAFFDRQPMVVSAPNKSSGWFWAIAIIVVILVGGGVGFLVYLSVS